MRSPIKTFIGSVTLGVIGVSYAVGAAQAANEANQQLADLAAVTTQPSQTPTPIAPAAKPATKKVAAKKTSAKTVTVKKATKKKTSAKKSTGSSSGGTSGGSAAAVSGSKTSKSVGYNFGTVRLTVTKSDGKITAIDAVTFDYTRGPNDLLNQLVDKALAAQSSKFSNISRVTYTSKAFKAALDSALSKF